MPGDILLFSPIQPAPVARLIQSQQERWGASPEHARFTHAAIYIGLDHLICEAVKSGVKYSTLDSCLDEYCWLARRCPGMTRKLGQRIAAEAVVHLGERYDWQILVAGILTRGNLLNAGAAKGLVCSRLCDRAVTSALLEEGFLANDLGFHPNPQTLVTPAILSSTPKLVDVDLDWRRVDA
jgi:hypothetical protein